MWNVCADYVDNIGSIQTMATLIAGFAFTALAANDGKLSLGYLTFMEPAGWRATPSENNSGMQIEPRYEMFSVLSFLNFGLNTLEAAAVAFTLGEMLFVMIETLIARLLGSRLVGQT